eukprot:2752570-Pyramimonas_sp.AAC.1
MSQGIHRPTRRCATERCRGRQEEPGGLYGRRKGMTLASKVAVHTETPPEFTWLSRLLPESHT